MQEIAAFIVEISKNGGGVSVGAVGAIAPTVFEKSPIVT